MSLVHTRTLRIREALSWEAGPSLSEPMRYVVDVLPDGTEVAFLKPGKEAFRKKNPRPHDMKPVVRGYESAAFEDVWSILARAAITDAEAFKALAVLIYRSAFHIDHVAEDGRVRYRPAPPVAACITDLGRRLRNILPDGSAWALLHFVDLLGWNEDVKYHVVGDEPTFKGKFPFTAGRLATLLTAIRVPYEVARFAKVAVENATSPDRLDFRQLIRVMQEFSRTGGICPAKDEQLVQWLSPYLRA